MKTRLVILLLIAPVLCAQDKPSFAVPHMITKSYETDGCLVGYEGHYLDLSSQWDPEVKGGTLVLGSSRFMEYDPKQYVKVCVSKELVKVLIDKIERETKKMKESK
jgi:hypothetical protein